MKDPNRTIQFAGACPPRMTAGPYTLTVTQEIVELGADLKEKPGGIRQSYGHSRRVHVQGGRFAIDPMDITAVFPPDGSEGDFAGVLPHVTFSRRALPWEQKSGPTDAPWLALLVFHEGDEGGIPEVRPAMVGDLSRKSFQPGDSPSSGERPSTLAVQEQKHSRVIVSYPDAGKDGPTAWKLWPGEKVWDPCQVVDISVSLFRGIAPLPDDLRWLGHSRILSSPSGDAGNRESSVIIGNRLPQRDGVSLACLVSLEGIGSFLAPGPLATTEGKTATHVRLVVLKSWTFRCGANLRGFHQPLTTGVLQIPQVEPVSATRTPEERAIEAAWDAKVKNALAMGYTALNHDTRWGDQAVSWYRGPLLPFGSEVALSVPPPPICEDGYLTGTTPLSTADEALRYDPGLGMLDVSYAAAWQLGRLLALRDKTFSCDLYRWKGEVKRKILAAAAGTERAGRAARLAGASAQRSPGAPAETDAFALLAKLIEPALDALKSAAAGRSPDVHRGPEARSSVPRMDPLRSARELINDRDRLKQVVQGVQAPDSVVRRLESLRRLEGVPLDYLVPDERMLPPDSLRFFQVDPNWTYSLVEGAYSVARVSTDVQKQDAATCPHDVHHQVSGFLLRSALVSGWPDLRATVEVSNPAVTYQILRCERITPDILLCLVEVEGQGTLTSVTFQVPPESNEFHLPDGAGFRDQGRSVLDVQRLAHGSGDAGEFALRLTPRVTRPVLKWDTEREILSLEFKSKDGADRYEWQFHVNDRPFQMPVSFTLPPSGHPSATVEIRLPDDLPPGAVAVRVRAAGNAGQAVPGPWMVSGTLERPAAHGAQPVLRYHVGDDLITAEWPATTDRLRLAAQLHWTSVSGKGSSSGPTVKLDSPPAPEPIRMVFKFGENLQPGDIQVRFRTTPTPEKAASTLPGVWATSTQTLFQLLGPILAGGEMSYSAGVLKLVFYDRDQNVERSADNTVEFYLAAAQFGIEGHVCHMQAVGRRVEFTVKPEDVPSGRYWIKARVIGREDRVINSPLGDAYSQVFLLGRPVVTASGPSTIAWVRIEDAFRYQVFFEDERGEYRTVTIDASPSPGLDLVTQGLPAGKYRVRVQAIGVGNYAWTGAVSEPTDVTINP